MLQFKILICLSCLTIAIAKGQEVLNLSLNEVVALAQSDAPDVLIAKTRLSTNYWEYQSFLADFKPQIDLEGTLPNLNRSIDPIIQPDGSISYRARSFMSNRLGISLQQNLVSTGGRIFAQTSLERTDIFQTASSKAFTSYLNIPFSINFVQPLFAFNSLKWSQKIEPVRYKEATRIFAEEMESIAFNAAQLFFEVYAEQLNEEAALREKNNADTLYQTSAGRFEVGRIAETDLLQIELRAKNAEANLARARLNLQSASESLRNFLGLTTPVKFLLQPPSDIPSYTIDETKALEYARSNRSRNIALDRQLMEADRNVALAKANSNPDINIFTSFGLSQQATGLSDSYQDLQDREVVNIGIQMPLADWGKARSRRAIATSNKELTEQIVAQERINFEREITLKVQQFDLVRNQVDLAYRAYEVSLKRQDITQKRYLIGKVSLTELNISIDERESARQAYILALRNFWLAHYELRNLILYDFENDVTLVKSIEIENKGN